MEPSPSAKRISIRKYSKVHEYHDAYDDVTKMLRRMEKRGVVKCIPGETRWSSNIWTLPGTKEVSPEFREHELDITKLYGAYWPFFPNELEYWDWHWQNDEIENYGIHKKDSFLFDARMKFRKTWFFWEINRGSKSPDQLRDQVKGYYDFSCKYPDINFHVIWTLDYQKWGFTITDEQRKERIARDARILLTEFNEYKRGEQFLVTSFAEVLAHPKGKVLISTSDPEHPKSILELTPL